MRRFFQVQAVLALLVFSSLRSIQSIDPAYQRCNFWLSSKDFGWETSSCQECINREEEEDFKRTANVNVFIQITAPKLEPQLISIASALLMERTNVTVFYVNFHRGTTEDYSQVLRRRILSGIPCSRVGNLLEARLVVRPIEIAWNIREYCSQKVNTTLPYIDPVQPCFGITGPDQYRLYARWFRKLEPMDGIIPDVFVTDMHGYGALFIAEEFGIPSLVLQDQHSFYETTGQRRGQGTSTFWYWIRTSIISTLRDLVATKVFSDINRFRSLLRLKRIRHRSALWNSATAVAVLAHEFNASVPWPQAAYPPVLHLQTPILPPCVACRPNIDTTNQAEAQRNTVTVLFLPPHDMPNRWVREVARGLSIARRNLLSYDVDTCSATGTSNCWHDRIDLQVKWLVDLDLANYQYKMQDPLPLFIQLTHATLFLDTVIYFATKEKKNMGPTIILAICDDEARAALLLGVPILCLPTRTKIQQSRPSFKVRHLQHFRAREIATKLTSLVWELGSTFSSEPTSVTQLDNPDRDSLFRLVTAIRAAGTLVPTPEWPPPPNFKPRSPKELQWLFASTMQKRESLITGKPDDELSSTCTLLWWISVAILVVSLALFVVPHASKVLHLPGTSRNRIAVVLSDCVESWVARFPEVHNAWDSLKKKWKDGQNGRERRTHSLNKRQQSKKTNGSAKASSTKATDTHQRKRSDKQR